MGSARDKIRTAVLNTHQPKKEVITFFGELIELRQMTLGDVIKAGEEENRQNTIINSLINFAFVPDTDEKVFEEGDADQFKTMPFGKDFNEVAKALTRLTDLDFLDGKLASSETPSTVASFE